MKERTLEDKILDFKKQERETEDREIELVKEYHKGIRDGYERAAHDFAGEDVQAVSETATDEGFMRAIEMLGTELGINLTKTRANTKNGIIRAAARMIRDAELTGPCGEGYDDDVKEKLAEQLNENPEEAINAPGSTYAF